MGGGWLVVGLLVVLIGLALERLERPRRSLPPRMASDDVKRVATETAELLVERIERDGSLNEKWVQMLVPDPTGEYVVNVRVDMDLRKVPG